MVRAHLGPIALVLAGAIYMTARAVPRIPDGSEDLRRVHHVMNDEALILEKTWAMVERGDLDHGIAVYPGFYPYAAAAVKVISGAGAEVSTVVERTRWLSLFTMLVTIALPFVLFAWLAQNWWASAIFTFFFAVHPETVLWASRVHPDAFLLLFDHAALGCFGLALAKDRRFLWAATALAGLSAGTKLVGCFLMVPIAGFLVWEHRRDPPRMLRQLGLHSLLFFAVFAMTTPNVILDPEDTINGFVTQNKRNRRVDATPLNWWPTFISDRGLGWSGVIAVIVGLGYLGVSRWRARTIDGVGLVAIFGLFYLSYILIAVRLTLPRYAAPAMWPLLFVAFTQIRSKPIAGALLAMFLVVDLPKQRTALDVEDSRLQRTFTPVLISLGHHLERVSKRRPGPVLTSAEVWVPTGVPWEIIWSLDEVARLKNVAAVVAGPALGRDRSFAERLGYTATATIGSHVIYEPRGALRPQPKDRK
jgi:hypothetical protein